MSNAYGPGGFETQQHHNVGASAVPFDGGYGGRPLAAAPSQQQNYPPTHNQANPSYMSSTSSTIVKNDADVSIRYVSRTPSPTPSEAATLNRKGLIDWKAIRNWRYWVRREWLWYYIIFGIIFIIVVLISVYDKQIVHWLQPTAQKLRNLPAGWVVPIAIFFIISFPPLFGHEILAILVGVVWGLWIGFAITAAGTFVGEIGNFYAFRYCCRARGEKYEKTKIQYACLARIVRDGGFKVALVARFSAIPGHFTTAVFSTCGMNIFVFSLAAILSLPKQFITVYIGVILEQEGDGTADTKNKIISYVVLAVTTLVTIVAMRYLFRKMDEVKHEVIYERRKARQAKLERAYSSGSAESGTFNPRESDTDLPLNPGESAAYQQWDSQGNAVGYVGDPRLHAPSPKRHASSNAGVADVSRIPTFRSEGGGGYSGDFAPPTRMQGRQESVDSVAWDTSNQGMGHDALRLPTIAPHTPLSGGFVSPNASAGTAAGRTAYQPPAGPPPRLQQQSPANTGLRNEDPVPPPLLPPPQASPSVANFKQPPRNLRPGASSAPASDSPRVQSPTQYQYASAYEPSDRLGSGPLPSPQFAMASQSRDHASAPSPQGGYMGSSAGTHSQEASDGSAYYTPAHSRVGTEAEQPGRVFSPPPPSYRTDQPDGLR